jgi:hypothetical protein
MRVGDLDLAARRLRTLAGCSEWDVVLPGIIAQRLFGEEGYEVVHGLGLHGELLVWDGGGRVRVSASASDVEQDFAAGHELGHFSDHLEGWGLAGDALEEACNVFAAAIMMPPLPFWQALDLVGDNWAELATLFGVTETAAILRTGELTGRQIAVVAPATCRARGDGEWPPEQVLRAKKAAPGPGMASARLRDDPRRFVITGSDEGPKSGTG